jgi:hypothetical protein
MGHNAHMFDMWQSSNHLHDAKCHMDINTRHETDVIRNRHMELIDVIIFQHVA